MGPFVVLGHPARKLCIMHGRGDLPWLPVDAAVRLQVQEHLRLSETLLDGGLLLLQPLLQVVDPGPALSELVILFLQCIVAMKGLLLMVDNPPKSINLSLDAEVPKSIKSSFDVGVKGVREGLEGGKDEAGGRWCLEGESMEGLQVNRAIVAHGPYEHGLPQVEAHTQILGCYLIPTLVLECEAADVLVWLVRVPLRARMIPVVIASWRQVVVDLWVHAGNCCCSNPC